MHRLKFSIKTLLPTVITSTSNATVMTETHSEIGGSIIRGIFAARFVESQKLKDEAHDEIFREIFFGGLRFLPATPEILNARSFVLPLSLQRGKAGTADGEKIQDLLKDEASRQGYKSFRGYGTLKDEEIFSGHVKTNMFMHMSRNGERERLVGRSVDGQIYNYEAVDAGQSFQGEIIGDKEILLKLRDGLNLNASKMSAYIGRSKFTQYGKCLVTIGDIENVPDENFPESIFLRLDTPLIPIDDCFIEAKKILAAEVIDKLGKNFSLGKVFASSVEIENFVVTWGMKRPRVLALAAGTVFELKTSTPLTDDEKISLNEKIYKGFGTRTEEGFGQLRLWRSSDKFTVGKLDDEKLSKPQQFSAETIELAKKILAAHLLEQIRLYAHEDAEKLRPQLKRGNMTHFFTRLGGILSSVDKKNIRENFQQQLEVELRGGSQFEEHLKTLYMANGQKFFDVFIGKGQLPHEAYDLINEKELAEVRGVIDFNDKDFSDDEFFLEYLTNYFRFARKLAAASKGGKARE